MLEGHEPDGDTQYRIGSLTKTFIAVLVMRLRDEGRLDLADPLGKHLDAGEAAGATIAQLLSHTAGLASETPGPWWERSPGELRPGLGDILGPARHPAGRLFHYSNPGYGLLGALIGQLRGHGWEEALRREILELTPAAGRGRASRFRAEPDGTWTGLDGYYTGEALCLVRGADGTVDHLDLGSFVFTREPYEPEAPLAARPDPEGWRAF